MGKLPVKATLHTHTLTHTGFIKCTPIREKVMNEGNSTLITSRDMTDRRQPQRDDSSLITEGRNNIFAFVHKLNMNIKVIGLTKYLSQVHTEHKNISHLSSIKLPGAFIKLLHSVFFMHKNTHIMSGNTPTGTKRGYMGEIEEVHQYINNRVRGERSRW